MSADNTSILYYSKASNPELIEACNFILKFNNIKDKKCLDRINKILEVDYPFTSKQRKVLINFIVYNG